MFRPFLLTPKIVIVGREVLHHLSETDMTDHNGHLFRQILGLDLPEEPLISPHPSRWNRAHLLTVRTPRGLLSLEVVRHVIRHPSVAAIASAMENSSARRSASLTPSDTQLSRPRHASTKKMSSTAGTADVPRLTRAIENGIGTTSLTLTTERLYVRPQWGSGEVQLTSYLTRYVASNRTPFPTLLSLPWKRILSKLNLIEL
jgi:hypothetical protein